MGSQIIIYGSQLGFSEDGKAETGEYKTVKFNPENVVTIELENVEKDIER